LHLGVRADKDDFVAFDGDGLRVRVVFVNSVDVGVFQDQVGRWVLRERGSRTKAKMDFIERGRLRQKGENRNWHLVTPWHLSRFVVNGYDSESDSLDL
jgi:hypothetical protein